MKRLFFSISTLSLFFSVASLSADEFEQEAKRHIIVVDHVGRPLEPTITKTRGGDQVRFHVKLHPFKPDSGKPSSETASSGDYRAYIANIVQNIRSGSRIMFFIHGGMNEKAGAVQKAARLLYQKKIKGEGYYPLFICWDSPPFETYWENVRWIRAGKTEKYFRGKLYALLTTPFYLLADIGRAATRLPAELSALGYNDVYSIYPNKFTEYTRMEGEYCYLRSNTDPKIKIAAAKGPNQRNAGEEVLRNISLLLTAPLKIASEPILDAVGVGAWDNMVRRTDTMFDAVPTRAQTEYQEEYQELLKDSPTGALSIFMEELSKAKPDCEVTLVAHSMGAIIANRIIHQYSKLYYRNIVYMAAACRVFDFENSVLPYLQDHSGSKFYNLSLHPKCESGEIFYWGKKIPVDVPPRGSLLVWIDNIFGYPPSEKRRMFGVFQTALIESHNIPGNLRKQIFYKAFAAGVAKPDAGSGQSKDENWNPQRHGDFSDAPFWKWRFWEPVRNSEDDAICHRVEQENRQKIAAKKKVGD